MQKLLKSLLLLNLFLMLAPTLKAASLDLDDFDEPVFKLRGDSGADINDLYFNLGGDGSTADAAITLYLPFKLTGAQDNAYYLDTTDLPDILSENGGLYLRDIDALGYTNEELYVAVKDNDNSDPVYRIVSEIPSSQVEAPFVSYADLCATSELNCLGIADSISTIKDNVELVLFFMPNETDYATNDEVTLPDTVGQAIFFKLIISAAVTDIQTRSTMSILSTYAGDSTAILEYTGSFGGNGAYISRMASYLVTPGGATSKSDIYEVIEDVPEGGNIKLTGLANGTQYRAGIAYLDYFGFISPIVESTDFQPRPIEKLLEGNQCYLVSAGFGHNHYVLDYFRYIRDEYLLNFWPGRIFVNFYYNTAPNFVKYILDNKSLAFTIKMYSFSIYFVLQNILFILLFIFVLFVLKSRREIKYALQSINRR